jgi:hypothetical protein
MAQPTRTALAALAARRIPQTFECRPTPSGLPFGVLPDELMIDWIGVPEGATASIYLPAASSDAIIETARGLYPGHPFSRIDDYTVGCDASGVTYLPIPAGSSGNYAGLLTLEWPSGSPSRGRYQAIVRQVSSARQVSDLDAGVARVRPGLRAVIGAFQISVPIVDPEELLAPEERNLAFFRWILSTLQPGDRWHPVIKRYVGEIALRVHGLGGAPAGIVPSPVGAVPHHRGSGSPEPIPGPRRDRQEYTGKVETLIFDRFGDFEGFILATYGGTRQEFFSRQPHIEELARWAWQARIRTTVAVHEREPHIPVRIDLHAS